MAPGAAPVEVEVEELERERGRLALAADDGDPEAAARLAEIEGELQVRRIGRERAELAERERKRQAAEEQARQKEASKAAAERKVRSLAKKRMAIIKQIDTATTELVAALHALRANSDEMGSVSPRLYEPFVFDDRKVTGSWLSHQLSDLYPPDFGRSLDDRLRGGSLAEIEAKRLEGLIE